MLLAEKTMKLTGHIVVVMYYNIFAVKDLALNWHGASGEVVIRIDGGSPG